MWTHCSISFYSVIISSSSQSWLISQGGHDGEGINLTQLRVSDSADTDVAVYLDCVTEKNYKCVPVWVRATKRLTIEVNVRRNT